MLISLALIASIAIPLAAAPLLALWPARRERSAARVALGATALSAGASAAAVTLWLWRGAAPFETRALRLVTHGSYGFELGLSLDWAAAAFLALVQFTSGTVVRFSRAYMHREEGFNRFFATILVFQGGMCLLTLASNLDLMFAGWETAGLASFLLIAFYRRRHAPVRNALKTYSIYRIADVGMLLGAYLEHSSSRAGTGLLLLLAAAGKSAQFPFSFWVVRAMEGPTPSSALFYGALSVHAGAYLLLRAFPIWGHEATICFLVGAVGLLTAVLCSLFSSVQHTVKGQIGYASVAQVGVIFFELALGLRTLALIHMICNALLRCYQLLVSPSAVAYLLRRQTATGASRPSEARTLYGRLPFSLRATLYTFAQSEGYLKNALKLALWSPLKQAGGPLSRHPLALVALATAGAACVARYPLRDASLALAEGAALVALALSFSACAVRAWERPFRSLAWISGSGMVGALAVVAAAHGRDARPALSYALELAAAGALSIGGTAAASRAAGGGGSDGRIPRLAGLSETHPLAALCALAGALGLAAFPGLPTFFSEGILLHSAFGAHRMLALAFSALSALNGYLAVRTFAFAFFGNPPPPGARAPSTSADERIGIGARRAPAEPLPEPAIPGGV